MGERIDVNVKDPKNLLKRVMLLVSGGVWAFFALKAFDILKESAISCREVGPCIEMEFDEVILVFAMETSEAWVLQEIGDAAQTEHFYYRRGNELPEQFICFH